MEQLLVVPSLAVTPRLLRALCGDATPGDFEDDWRLFSEARAATVALLRGLPAEAEGRVGFSGFFGPVTLSEYATHLVDHDIEHLAQITETRALIGT